MSIELKDCGFQNSDFGLIKRNYIDFEYLICFANCLVLAFISSEFIFCLFTTFPIL